jgi:hypothetical protein
MKKFTTWLKNTQGWPWGYIGLIIILVPFAFIGICNAYAISVQWYLENALANNVKAAHAEMSACESTYQAILQLKTDEKIALTNTGDPCPL